MQPTSSPYISNGLESLFRDFSPDNPMDDAVTEDDGPDAHVVGTVIVGSGYGGAISAEYLSRFEGAVVVLERGIEYLSGDFPERLADAPAHVRFASNQQSGAHGARSGLFDFRLGTGINTLVANGLGGGSLINAGVMERPLDDVFSTGNWPSRIREEGLTDFLDLALECLQAHEPRLPGTASRRREILEAIDEGEIRAAKVTIAPHAKFVTGGGVALDACSNCGGCFGGCNYNAKISLDNGLLAKAFGRGAKLYTGATVLCIDQTEHGWQLQVQHTDEKLRRGQRRPFRIECTRLILSAGTFGSTEILLRSQSRGLPLSGRLGEGLSANGDLIAFAADLDCETYAVAGEGSLEERGVIGPTITTVADLRRESGLIVEDLAVPPIMRRVFDEALTSARFLQDMAETDRKHHSGSDHDPAAISAAEVDHAMALAIICHDPADGRMTLNDSILETDEQRRMLEPDAGDASLAIDFPSLPDDPRIAPAYAKVDELIARQHENGRVLANPVWRPGSPELAGVLGLEGGPLVSVHPLGGCGMGDDHFSGVVDDKGCVYRADQNDVTSTYNNFLVLDGSIVPGSLGTNPALTIAALALRSIEAHAVEVWRLKPKLDELSSSAEPTRRERPRPKITGGRSVSGRRTRLETLERMEGQATLSSGEKCTVRLTLLSHAFEARSVLSPEPKRRVIKIDEQRSRLQIFSKQSGDEVLFAESALAGSLYLFVPEPSRYSQRLLRGAGAWFCNRGLRDLLKLLVQRLQRREAEEEKSSLLALAQSLLPLLSQGGARSRLEYELKIVPLQQNAALASSGRLKSGEQFSLTKVVTYGRRSSPIRQMMEAQLQGLSVLEQASTRLCVDPEFFSNREVPLFRVVEQEDLVSSSADLLQIMLYVGRVLLRHHWLSLEKPDAPIRRKTQRLAGSLPGMPVPEIQFLDVGQSDSVARVMPGMPVRVRLTRYDGRDRAEADELPPIVLIHGYSASSTTFAHPALDPGLARCLVDLGRDVWLVDLRTSCGLPTGTLPWSFEDVACEDIPLAIDYVLRRCDVAQVDVIAHCMGAAMFSMAALWEGKDALADLRSDLFPRCIRKAVFSQVTPIVRLTPANVGRAWLASYAQQFMPWGTYRFDRPANASALFDRFLSALPYPEEEYVIEHPFPITPKRLFQRWVGTRRRMDALYGRVFELKNMDRRVLDALDDFFGPMHLRTVSQVIHFNRFRMVTDRKGYNGFIDTRRLKTRLTFPIQTLHSAENGLVDPRTKARVESVLQVLLESGVESVHLPQVGHQDMLIGRRSATRGAFAAISRFLGP